MAGTWRVYNRIAGRVSGPVVQAGHIGELRVETPAPRKRLLTWLAFAGVVAVGTAASLMAWGVIDPSGSQAAPPAKACLAKADPSLKSPIIESTGSLPTPATTLQRAEELGAALATAHGLPGAEATIEQLRAIPAAEIIAKPATGRGLRTILDGRVKMQSIMDSFASGSAIDVPFIIGTNSDEGRLSGTQRVATHAMAGAPVWQYFFDYVPEWRRAEQPNGAPHAAEIPYVFDTLKKDRRADQMTAKDLAVGAYIHSCWVAFAKQPPTTTTIRCADDFEWPSRTEENGRTVAIFQERPSLGKAPELRSPPNGAPPGPTSRDEES